MLINRDTEIAIETAAECYRKAARSHARARMRATIHPHDTQAAIDARLSLQHKAAMYRLLEQHCEVLASYGLDKAAVALLESARRNADLAEQLAAVEQADLEPAEAA